MLGGDPAEALAKEERGQSAKGELLRSGVRKGAKEVRERRSGRSRAKDKSFSAQGSLPKEGSRSSSKGVVSLPSDWERCSVALCACGDFENMSSKTAGWGFGLQLM